jgi:hypothetical protein
MTTPTREDFHLVPYDLEFIEDTHEHDISKKTERIKAYIAHLEQSLESAEREAFEAGRKRVPYGPDRDHIYETFDDYKNSKGEK